MRFPDKLTVVALDRDTGTPAENVALVLTLFAARKNDYSVGPVITDKNGMGDITRDECNASIDSSKEMFIMDYSSSLEECRPFIEVRLHLPEHIEGMIRQYESSPDFWGLGFQDPKRLMAELRNVKNRDYEPVSIRATEEQILSSPQLQLLLSRRPDHRMR